VCEGVFCVYMFGSSVGVPVEECKGVVYSIPCVECSKSTLPGLNAALLAWPYNLLSFFYYCVITIINNLPSPVCRLVSYVLGFTRFYPNIRFTCIETGHV